MATTAHDLIRHHRFTVDDYHRIGESGALREQDRVELISGEIIEMPPIGSTHAGANIRIQKRLEQAVGECAFISTQNPILLGEYSEPQPDIALLRPRDDFYSASLPTPADVLLLIEIADSSLRYDREVKLPLYARHKIAATWIIDLQHRQLLLHSRPSENGYRITEVANIGKPIPLPGLDNLDVDLTGLF